MLFANIVSTLLGVLAVLILPKYLSGEQYGFYQMYLLYSGFSILLSLGLPDGIYLTLGGRDRKKIPGSLIKAQAVVLVIIDAVLFFGIALWAFYSYWPGSEALVFLWVCVSGFFTCVRYYFSLILQSQNRIKEYAVIIILERVISLVPILTMVLYGITDIFLLLIFDALGKLAALVYSLVSYKKLDLSKDLSNDNLSLKAFFSTIMPGMQLLIATTASMVIIGVVRIGVELAWDLIVFAQISLVVSIANMLTRLINAVAIPIFPALKTGNKKTDVSFYKKTGYYISLIFGFLLVFIYPIVWLLSWWLPDYSDALNYAILLVPMCLFESKMAVLVMSFCKSYREEKALLCINIGSIILCIIGTHLCTVVLHSLNDTLLLLVIVLAVRCIIGQWYLAKKHSLIAREEAIWDVVSTVTFVLTWAFSSVLTTGASVILFCIIVILGFKQKHLPIRR